VISDNPQSKEDDVMELRDVMTPNPTICSPAATAREAAELMRDQDIGDVLVQEDGGPLGIVTDRDIVTRAVAAGRDPADVPLAEISTTNVETVSVDTPVNDVIKLMSDKAIRRVPVVEGERPVGIVALGDLAVDRDPSSLLGDISAAPPNN
jgi:CBS domain-containing protein